MTSTYLKPCYVLNVLHAFCYGECAKEFYNFLKKKSIKVIISDNSVDQYEANLMRRICGLIYFPDKECAEIKLRLINSK